MRKFGAAEADIDRALEGADVREPDDFELWRENERTLQVFIGLRSQWSIVQQGIQGLRQEAIESALRVRRIPTRERETMLDDLLAMSDAAVEIMNGSHDG